jgi:hypothetical protein
MSALSLSKAEATLMTICLIINIVVLVPVTYQILCGSDRISVVLGDRCPARDILLSVYLSILITSLGLLVLLFLESTSLEAKWMAVGLLTVQIIYKFLTTILVEGGTPPKLKFNPVVASNMAIATVQLCTVLLIVFFNI